MSLALKYHLPPVGDRVSKLLAKSFASCGKPISNEGGDVSAENNILWSHGRCHHLIEALS
jgi:hypothetical protein